MISVLPAATMARSRRAGNIAQMAVSRRDEFGLDREDAQR
jgi:hypothetical protein